MKILILKDFVSDSSSNQQGALLFNSLKEAFLNKEQFLLCIDSELSMSSSFLNSSIGQFLDLYGINNFKKTVKIKTNKNQFTRLSNYINEYSELYLA